MILVDTEICIDFFSATQPGADALERLLTERSAVISAVSVFELYAGVSRWRRLDQVEALCEYSSIVGVTGGASRLAAQFYADFKLQGESFTTHDLLIAATALELEIPLLTNNEDLFQRIEKLQTLEPDDLIPSS